MDIKSELMFENTYFNKTVLITGHTGFKGSWLTTWLLKLGANVVGVSNNVPTIPSMFEVMNLGKKIKDIRADVRDLSKVTQIVNECKPDFIFHLAAQAIVSDSYLNPVDTISTNVIGTMNVLEVLRNLKKKCVAVFITSDKCYDNVEWVWGYRESDALGGKDIYSGSKGAAELVIKSYLHSFFKEDHPVRIGIGRAGNVIGGGDWANDRVVVDCIKAWSSGRIVEIRSPKATRPWQHVLEPLSGYLTLGSALECDPKLNGEAFNFGPRSKHNHTVVELMEELALNWGFENTSDAYQITDNVPFYEAGLLKLNCDKALFNLNWESTMEFRETAKMVSMWYQSYYEKKSDFYLLTLNQIEEYEKLAKDRMRNDLHHYVSNS